jgi:hypothetical protein
MASSFRSRRRPETPIAGGSAIIKLQRAPVKTGGSGR